MSEINIWDSLDLSKENLKTAYDYLITQADNFKNATKGELRMDIEVTRGSTAEENPKKIIVYRLYVVAPELGNFKRKLLNIVEYADRGRFPVNILNSLDDDLRIEIQEEVFLTTIQDMLTNDSIRGAIESLYRQVVEHKTNTNNN